MSISIEEARRKIDILETLAVNPQLILTELFTEAVSGCNFLYQINVAGKYIFDYLIEYLMTIPVFQGCTIKGDSSDIFIYMDAIKWGKYQDFQTDDKIFKIDLNDKTFRSCQDCLLEYEKAMRPVEEREVATLSDWWARFENLTIKKRFRNAAASLSTGKRKWVRISNFLFWLSARKKSIDEALQKEQEKIQALNQRESENYSERIERQSFYLEQAPGQIERIKGKQRDIAGYLMSIGFQENPEMSAY